MISKEVKKVISIFDKAEFDEFLEDNYLEWLPEVDIKNEVVSYYFEKKWTDNKSLKEVEKWKPSTFKNEEYVANQQRFIEDYRDYKRGFTDNLEYLNSAVSSLFMVVNYLMKENEKLREGKK